MKIEKYLDSLLPTFSRGRLMEDLAIIREELKDNTLPPLKSIANAFGKRKFESQWVKEYDARFQKEVNFRYSGNFFVGMYETLQEMEESIDTVESLINRYYTEDIVRDAMTILRVNLLQYLETMSFATRYARRIAVAAMSIEVDAVSEKQGVESVCSAGEIEWLTLRREHFFTALSVLSDKKENMEKKFTEMPDIKVTKESVDQTQAVVGISRVDPFKFGLIPIVLNPIYHIRMAIADWQVTRFKAAQEEKRMLEFKLLKLKLTASSNPKKDAKLDEQINYTEGRLQKLNYKLKEMEEDYGTA